MENALVIKPKENKTYVDYFLRLVSPRTPRLSIHELGQMCCSGSAIGQVLDKQPDYKRFLSLKKFESVGESETSRYGTCLTVNSIHENYCLGIGYNGNLKIFQQNMGKKREEYFPTKRNSWIRPPLDFLRMTRSLLPVSFQEEFKGLFTEAKQ